MKSALERVRQIRADARARIVKELEDECRQRHERGERLVAGIWVPQALAGNLQRARVRRQRVAFAELLALAALSLFMLALVWRMFGFLFLPHVIWLVG